MEKVKIKRVKKPKKLITGKEKLLTGLGVGSTLLGMAGGGAPNAQNKQSPIVRKQETEKGSVKEKVKKALSKIFGIPEAKAFISTNNPCAPLDNPFAPSGNPWGWWYDWQNQGGGGGGDNFGGGGGSGVDMGGPAYVGAIQTSDGKWYHTLWGTARLFDSEAEALAAAAGVSAAQPLTIRLNGDYYNFINQGEEFTDPGYEATGADGQTVRVDISGTVDKNTPALYKITYTAWDDLGNTATATRIVTVLPRAGGTTTQSPPHHCSKWFHYYNRPPK
ncbi:MAG: DUF5011 domain-containing protein [Candidatus Doudnabacteria bacterium]|nr:DUF5011 domain-containing protein [Candidatus Doudnabacteria bacterium]